MKIFYKNILFTKLLDKRVRFSKTASLCEQKSPPHRFPNPQGYRDTTI